jgi:hypothetical protein
MYAHPQKIGFGAIAAVAADLRRYVEGRFGRLSAQGQMVTFTTPPREHAWFPSWRERRPAGR